MSNNKSTQERPRKLQRISQACDLCHRRSIRCRPSAEEAHKCQNCYDFAIDCTYNRPSRRRRNPSAAQGAPGNLLPVRHTTAISPISPTVKSEGGGGGGGVYPDGASMSAGTLTGAYEVVREGRPDDLLSVAWHCFAANSQAMIYRYLEIYMEVVYPLFPLFHGPTLWERLHQRQHLTDRGFFASVMAACALAAARARDGASSDKQLLNDETSSNSSEVFFSAAQDNISKDLTKMTGLGYMRACALLALTSIQYGQIQMMHHYMGHYLTLGAMQHFHDESYWPEHISVEEREERRRLFWAMYNFDVYTSVVFNTIHKSQETHSNVAYPSEVSDEELTSSVTNYSDPQNWLRGYNFATDLYRVLEHALKRLRISRYRREDRLSIVRLMISNPMPDTQIMDNVQRLYHQLPERFKDYRAEATGDRSHDIYGFQAANIQATLQLVRITLLEARGSNAHSVQEKCHVAETVLNTFRDIPQHYLRAISTPLVYLLGGIGHILSSVMQGVLNEGSYAQVRALTTGLADLLEDLETVLQPAAGSSRELRKQIDKIDQYMQAQREMLSTSTATPQHIAPYPEHASNGNGPYPASNGTNGNHPVLPSGSLPPLTNNMGMRTPHDDFQLPPEVTQGWPWPFDLVPESNQYLPIHGSSDSHA